MAHENEAHLYGTADPANRMPPASEGMRGERATDRAGAANPALKRVLTLDSGRMVEVREDSGVGWAEAAGRAGLANQGAVDAATDGAAAARSAGWGAVAAALAGGALAGLLAIRLTR